MNEEKLRIALAEALGWQVEWGILNECLEVFCGIPPYPAKNESVRDDFPEWLTSRDAAIEAVIELCDTEEKKSHFAIELSDLIMKQAEPKLTPNCLLGVPLFYQSTATPLQICTALAKALNLNVEE